MAHSSNGSPQRTGTPSVNSTKNIKLKTNPLAELTVAVQDNVQALTGIVMSEIRYIAPEKLQPNPLNSIFPQESAAYFDELAEDIRERGITDPLVAKPDGTLLTGHNRLTIAKRLGLPRVPVRYVQTGIQDERKELEFVIKDNLLRRQLTDTQRVKLYERLYPNFHERRGKAIMYGKNLSQSRGGNSVTPPNNDDILTVQEIASATGQKPENVKQQLARFYRKHPEVLSGTANGAQPHDHTGSPHHTPPAKLQRMLAKTLDTLRTTLDHADEKTRLRLMKDIKQFVRTL
jgi:ParB-like chromosome segregation protein Spo0J